MRKTISKKIRKNVYQKYNGHCAYCGCSIPETGTTEVHKDKDFKSEYIIFKNKIKTKQCSIEYAQGYLYCLINMFVTDDSLYDEYSKAIDDIGVR